MLGWLTYIIGSYTNTTATRVSFRRVTVQAISTSVGSVNALHSPLGEVR